MLEYWSDGVLGCETHYSTAPLIHSSIPSPVQVGALAAEAVVGTPAGEVARQLRQGVRGQPVGLGFEIVCREAAERAAAAGMGF